MIGLLINLLIILIIFGVVWYVVGILPIPEPFKTASRVVIGAILLIWLLLLLTGIPVNSPLLR